MSAYLSYITCSLEHVLVFFIFFFNISLAYYMITLPVVHSETELSDKVVMGDKEEAESGPYCEIAFKC